MRKNKHFIKLSKKSEKFSELSQKEVAEFVVPATDICVCCGRSVPEGIQVCPICKKEYGDE